jgi:hypothetical protein
MMTIPVVESRSRTAGLVLVSLLVPGGSLIALSVLLGKRMWTARLNAPMAGEDESRYGDEWASCTERRRAERRKTWIPCTT